MQHVYHHLTPAFLTSRKTVPATPAPAGPPDESLTCGFWTVGATLILYVLHAAVDRPDLRPGTDALERGKTFIFLSLPFGAMGHHLPGMIRAYGDRALFPALQVALQSLHRFFSGGRLRDLFFCGTSKALC